MGILERANELNAKIKTSNEVANRQLGQKEAAEATYRQAVESYKEMYGVDITPQNLQQVYNEAYAKVKGELEQKEEIMASIERGDYHKEVELEIELEPEVEAIKPKEPKPETPKVEEPKVETPKVEEPKEETPKVEEPKVETPKVEEPKVETPKVETPKVEEPKVETPKVETPKVETPKVETPKVETPKVAPEEEILQTKTTIEPIGNKPEGIITIGMPEEPKELKLEEQPAITIGAPKVEEQPVITLGEPEVEEQPVITMGEPKEEEQPIITIGEPEEQDIEPFDPSNWGAPVDVEAKFNSILGGGEK